MAREELQGILNEFGKAIGIPELSFDENGYCCLSFDDVVVNMEVDEPSSRLLLYANLGDLPKERLTELYETLLDANFLYRGTFGASLGIDRKLNMVVLAYQTPAFLVDLPQLHRILENFVNAAESWTRKVDQFTTVEDDAPSPDAPPMGSIRA